jgi:glycosyltransferase involved in cell wall biosynthesis
MTATPSLNVGVTIDLRWREDAGGHVKCWEQLAAAASALTDELQLTIHFLGDENRDYALASNVHYKIHRPRFSTARLPFLNRVADHTDLARRNPSLEPDLAAHQVIHCTHPPFALSNTALHYARAHGRPVCCSVHTETVEYTRVFTRDVLQRLVGRGRLGEALLNWSRLDINRARAMEAKIVEFWGQCDWIVVSRRQDEALIRQHFAEKPVSYLRRGIDKNRFDPDKRDRPRLRRTYGIDEDKAVLLFVGRLDDGKNVMFVARLVRYLRQAGYPVHGLFIGEGSRAADIRDLLEDDTTLPGTLPHHELPWHYASADLFVFPSPYETYGNVVLEAKACGLPSLVADSGGACQLVLKQGDDGFALDTDDLPLWQRTVASLLDDRPRLTQMGRAARASIEQHWPSWEDVLKEDLLPVWRKLVAG